MSLRLSPSLTREEGLPCLTLDEKHPVGDSAMSEAFSSVSSRPKEHCRKCILGFLLIAILGLAVLVSFVLGQYISDYDQRPIKTTTRQTNNNSTTSAASRSPTTPATTTFKMATVTRPPSTVNPSNTTKDSATPFHQARLIPLAAVKNLTLDEVAVPQHEDEDEWKEMTRTVDINPKKDFLLVPLSTALRPTQYDLMIDITNFQRRKIHANVSIHLLSYGNTTDEEIVFHAGPELKIERMRLRVGDEIVSIVSIKQETNKKLYRLILKERLRRGEYLLDIEYTASVCDNPIGGVTCYYEPAPTLTNASEVRIVSFTTKFEPAHARSFLPCWDEPAVKSVFQVTVRHPAHLKVLSNTGALLTRSDDNSRSQITVFKQTPPMSAYLLALAVGDFVALEMHTKRNVPLTIWTFREDLSRASFAADFAPKMLDKQEEEMEILYPLSKLDMVAARSFTVGAMENWGLIVFDSQTLLQQAEIDDSMAMTVDRHHYEYRIAKIITHEIAHQWFGNLVTMRDWSELWLNEGFASFYVYDLLSARYPQLTEHEYYNRLAFLLRKQSGNDKPALVRELARESQVEAAFDTTHLYTKGCVVVRMIRDLISPVDFQSGIRRYLRNNAYGAVTRAELFASLPVYADHGAENERIDDVIEGWLVNEGMPEVTVRVFLYDEGKEDKEAKNEFSFTDNSFNSEEKSGPRLRRDEGLGSQKEGEEVFDDSLFEDFPEETRGTPRPARLRHRNKHGRSKTRRPQTRTLIEERKEDLKRPAKSLRRSPSDRWSIPFSYMFGSVKSSEGQVIRQFWLKNRSLAFTDVELAATAPLLANPDWAYPYRVNYDYANWKMLTRLLHEDHLEIPVKSRMQLIVDGEFFLSQSGLPHLYLYLLSYLEHEDSLSVALMGLDAVHSLVETFQGTAIVQPLLRYLKPVIARLSIHLVESQSDVEQAALWLVDPHRLTRFYQLRCAVNHTSCEDEEQVRGWLLRGHYSSDMHQKTTALCHYLAMNGGGKEAQQIEADLSRTKVDPTLLQMATCVRDRPSLAKTAARIVVGQRNAAVYDSVLRSDLSQQHYNIAFRRVLWKAIGELPERDRRFLFSVDEAVPSAKSISLLHAVRTTEELNLVRSLLPSWGRMSVHLVFLSRQLAWQEKVAAGVLAQFLSADTPSV